MSHKGLCQLVFAIASRSLNLISCYWKESVNRTGRLRNVSSGGGYCTVSNDYAQGNS